jgi:hypothetical protein
MKTIKVLFLIFISGFIGYKYSSNQAFNKAVKNGATKAKIATRDTINKVLS